MAAVAAGTMVVTACTGSTSGPTSSSGRTASGNAPSGPGLAAITPAGTKPVSSVVWATNRDVISLDPITSAGYPEYTADSLMCESLLRQAPDGSLQPGLATISNPSPATLAFTLRPGVKFWDGHPVTSADVVYSLDRAASPKLGGYYSGRLDRIASVTATSPTQVTIKLTQPDYWLEGELSSMPGIIIEKSFAEKQGKNYGTPAGSIMCTGAYMLHSWTPGVGVVAVRNPHYWNPSVHPLAGQITLKGVHDVTSLTSGLLTGDIQGTYGVGLPTLNQLKGSSAVRVNLGPGWSSDVLEIASLTGVLGNLNVRRALSMALNRQGIINSVYQGAAQLPRWMSNPGTFGYGQAGVRPGLRQLAGADPEHRRGQEAGPAGRGHREDDHLRHHQPAGRGRRGDGRLSGRGPGDRAEGRAEVGFGPGLHQLLRRPSVQGRGRRLPGGGLRRLRRSGRAAGRVRAGRGRETGTTSTPPRSPRRWSRRAAPRTRTSGRRWWSRPSS